jgi:hypothetical protein
MLPETLTCLTKDLIGGSFTTAVQGYPEAAHKHHGNCHNCGLTFSGLDAQSFLSGSCIHSAVDSQGISQVLSEPRSSQESDPDIKGHCQSIPWARRSSILAGICWKNHIPEPRFDNSSITSSTVSERKVSNIHGHMIPMTKPRNNRNHSKLENKQKT